MQDAIEAGTILIQKDTLMPDSLLPKASPIRAAGYPLAGSIGHGLEMSIHKQAELLLPGWRGPKRQSSASMSRRRYARAVKRLIAECQNTTASTVGDHPSAMSSFLECPTRPSAGHVRHIKKVWFCPGQQHPQIGRARPGGGKEGCH